MKSQDFIVKKEKKLHSKFTKFFVTATACLTMCCAAATFLIFGTDSVVNIDEQTAYNPANFDRSDMKTIITEVEEEENNPPSGGSNPPPPGPTPPVPDLTVDGYIYVRQKANYAKQDGYIGVVAAANDPLDVSDNLTKDEIKQVLATFQSIGGFSNPVDTNGMADAADAFYTWQQNTNHSITGVLGIWLSEGPWNSGIKQGTNHALEHWNFGNIKPSKGDPSFTGAQGIQWLDFKAKYNGNFGDAVAAQLSFNSKYYNRGQNTYYKMSMWLNTSTAYAIKNATELQGFDDSSWCYCYCPYWDTPSITITDQPEDSTNYHTWFNNSAANRARLLQSVGR